MLNTNICTGGSVPCIYSSVGRLLPSFEGLYGRMVQTECAADWNHLVQSHGWRLLARLHQPGTAAYRCRTPWGPRCIFIRYLGFKWFENCISSRGKICWMASSPTLGNLWAFQYFRYFHKQIATSRISLMIYHQQGSVWKATGVPWHSANTQNNLEMLFCLLINRWNTLQSPALIESSCSHK